MKNFLKSKKFLLFCIATITSVFYVFSVFSELSLMHDNRWLGIDMYFHMSRLEGLQNVFTNPINFQTYNGVGSGVNYFYPWLTYYPAILIHFFVNNWVVTMILFFVLITFVCFLIAYYYSGFILNSIRQQYVFAFLYVFSTYKIVALFQRADIGEVIAFSFLPMVVSSFYKLIKDDDRRYYIHLAIGMSLVIYSHVLTSVECIGLLFIILCINFRQFFSEKTKLLNLFKAIILTVLITAFYWVPLIEQAMVQKLITPDKYNLSDAALSLNDLFLNTINNSWGPSLGIIVSLGLIFSWKTSYHYSNPMRQMWIISIFGIFCVTKMFPWFILQNTPINVIQMPMRFLGIISVTAIFCVSSLVSKKWKPQYLVIILFCIASMQVTMAHSIKGDAQYIGDNRAFTAITHNEEKPYDYYPLKATNNKNMRSIQNKEFFTTQTDKDSHVLSTKKYAVLSMAKSAIFTVDKSESIRYVDTPFLYYKGVEAYSKNIKFNLSSSNRGTIGILLPKNFSGKIYITSHYTVAAKAAMVISGLSVLFVGLLLLRYFKLFKRESIQ